MAFAHPEDRSRATAADAYDRISVRDYGVTVEIGAFQVERDATQRLLFNVVVEVLPADAALDDDVDAILSYDKVTEAIDGELAAERLNLLETLAERIADRILRERQAHRVFVRIEKLDRGPAVLGVEILRAKSDVESAAQDIDIPRPFVVFLSQEALDSEHAQTWITAALDKTRPVIFCVPPLHSAQAADTREGRQICLLSMEQNAWTLAGLNDRCAVVSSRTELDWAIRQGNVSIWAPSRLVGDATDAPADVLDMAALVEWFAARMGTDDIVFVGSYPSGKNPSARRVNMSDTDF